MLHRTPPFFVANIRQIASACVLVAAGWVVSAAAASASDDATGTVSVGFGLAVLYDLPETSSVGTTQFGPGPSLLIPVRYRVAPHASLRATLRADVGLAGTSMVSWPAGNARVASPTESSYVFSGGLTVGPEFEIPLSGPVIPYFGAGLGVAFVGTYNNLGGPTQLLLDPTTNDLNSSGNVDPSTGQPVIMAEASLGARTAGDVGLWAELGLSSAYVAPKTLSKTENLFPGDAVGAQRQGYTYNPLRLGLGIVIAL